MTFKKLTEEEKAANRAARAALKAADGGTVLKAAEPDAEVPDEPTEPGPDEAPTEQEPTFKTKLSAAAKAEITKAAHAKVQQQLVTAEKEKFMASELERLRAEAGLAAPSSLGGTHDETVTFTLDLGYEGQAYVQLNQPHGPKYYHGAQYSLPRHVFNTLNDIGFRGHLQTRHVEGKSAFAGRKYGTVVSPGGVQHGVH